MTSRFHLDAEPRDTAWRRSVQDDKYLFPYHYIPSGDAGSHHRTRHWGWGYRYLGGIEVVLRALEQEPFTSVIDVGCGDGRFLSELAKARDDLEIVGVDYSPRAIAMARGMNPAIRFEAGDITAMSFEDAFDVATLVEVLEHIPVDQVRDFVSATARLIAPDGRLVLTVPHVNKKVASKHFQHFSSASLHDALAPFFRRIEIRPFDDAHSWILKVLHRVLGGAGRHFVITERHLNEAYYRLYRERYLFDCPEERCGRLLAVCHV